MSGGQPDWLQPSHSLLSMNSRPRSVDHRQCGAQLAPEWEHSASAVGLLSGDLPHCACVAFSGIVAQETEMSRFPSLSSQPVRNDVLTTFPIGARPPLLEYHDSLLRGPWPLMALAWRDRA
jgi:hypothetical protein